MKYIGIDTGTKTGLAVWDSRRRCFERIETVKIHKAMEIVRGYVDVSHDPDGDKVAVGVEDARKRKWFGTERMSREEERKKLQGVGSVKRDASIWEDFLSDLQVDFEMVEPKRNVTKLPKDTFRALTGFKGVTNEHNRDAAMLVFGR